MFYIIFVNRGKRKGKPLQTRYKGENYGKRFGILRIFCIFFTGILALIARTGAANVAAKKEKRIYEVLAVIGIAAAIAIGLARKVL